MTDDTQLDLAQLTLVASRALIGQEYVRRNDAGPDVTLRLISAETQRRDPTTGGDADRPFSLLFRGPADPRLTQGRHDLEHPRQSLAGIFLVPVQSDADGLVYEAVFA